MSTARLEYLDDIFKGRCQTLFSNAINIENSVTDSDLVVGGVLITGQKAPTLVTKEMISSMKKGSVVVDVAVDQGGCIETCRPTSHTNPTYEVDGVIHYGVPNMPGVVPRTSTYALTNVTLKYASMLAAMGVEDAVAKDKALMKGLNVYNGYVCYIFLIREPYLNDSVVTFQIGHRCCGIKPLTDLFSNSFNDNVGEFFGSPISICIY